ncbi:MAG: insulinase family protein, partial [Deltaproteobacteria bacterium]|nr:insulinase family protein [Deltaproteobacteria bacterium]
MMTTIYHGFELVRTSEISEIQSEARLYRHLKTGAGLLSVVSNDENKVFGITFRTPPGDSTGVAHILEHSVLCGSRKYPVKEPFVEILKGSLQTFLNAFTYPDKTCYPVASQNLKDFYNLVDVYLDAVLYPRIPVHIFQQEGWHYEMERPGGPLAYKGVVFNEMKGSYSSPERLLAEYSQQSLFPETTYGLDSGGDPKKIPDLTYEKFIEFHRRYYHPSNARIFFAGNDDPDERLRLVNDYLKDFERIAVDSMVPLQPRFGSPRRHTYDYPAGKEESSRKGMVTVNWMCAEAGDIETNMALHILGYVLLGTPGSPLRKALIDSGLGEDITGAGLEDEIRQLYFSAGLRGIEVERAGDVEKLIIDTLRTLSRDGIDPGAVEAAINTIEFSLRENNTGSYPRGLIFMLRALTTWLYDGDPVAPLAFEASLASMKRRIAADSRFFETLIERYFLDNTHRTTVLLTPDPERGERDEGEEKARLAGVRDGLDGDSLDRLYRTAETLRQIQETPDSPEALATIPVLALSDIDRKNSRIPLDCLSHRGASILYHDIPTSGIVYLDVGVNLHALSRQAVPYLPLFSRALLEMGTEREDFVKLSQRIDQKTGGIFPSLFTALPKGRHTAEARMFLRGKAMNDRVGDLCDIIREVLTTVRLDNRERFMQMALEEKARHEQSVVPGGHHMVNARLRAHFSEAGWLGEEMNGVSYLFFLRNLVKAVESDWNGVLATLREMQAALVRREGLLLNLTVDEKEYPGVEPTLHELIEGMPDGA